LQTGATKRHKGNKRVKKIFVFHNGRVATEGDPYKLCRAISRVVEFDYRTQPHRSTVAICAYTHARSCRR
jgi:hypothetical protein